MWKVAALAMNIPVFFKQKYPFKIRKYHSQSDKFLAKKFS